MNGPNCKHEHAVLLNGRTNLKANYFPTWIAALLTGMKKQLQQDKEQHVAVGGDKVGGLSVMSLDKGYNVDIETREVRRRPEYEHIYEDVFDDITGVKLPHAEVQKARAEEIDFSEVAGSLRGDQRAGGPGMRDIAHALGGCEQRRLEDD